MRTKLYICLKINMMMKNLFYLTFLMFFFSSCQKEVFINLNNVTPIIVITGSVTDKPGPYTVTLSKTVNFYNPNVFPPVDSAQVTISDNTGKTYTLAETSAGVYQTNILTKGIPGTTYTLNVVVPGGGRYTSVSTMPFPVKIDTVTMTKTTGKRGGFGGFGGGGGGNNIDTVMYTIDMSFHDPAQDSNYYRTAQLYAGKEAISLSVFSDRYSNGKIITPRTMRLDSSLHVIEGDSLTVELESIDKATYNFFRTFRNVESGAGTSFLSASPANPISNISNGALGYFTAYSVTSKNVLIP